ncbi:MAG: ATP-binding cassette domain-containing protein [Acidobacteria bacterium]|nr:ATP-binding cassette domain-containing protein [Acidobacteriota bacterium]
MNVNGKPSGFAIEAQDLLKNYGELIAVNRVSFGVFTGEAFGLLGPNGAGKSTIMRMIYCRTPLTSGSLRVVGLDVARQPRTIKESVGVVPQENNLDPDLNVRENLLVYARYFRIPRRVAERRADELIEFIELNDKRDARIETLSGGMKRRLMIARALINNPPILILDEPTTGLDPHLRLAIWDKLRELRDQGLTILLSTHYMDEAEKLCDRLVIIDHGQILVSGSPRELIERHALHFTLEARGCNGRLLQASLPQIIAERRGSTHFYFASSAEHLAPLLRDYEDCEAYLRPSNLEDVFLRLTDRERLS